jgi:hypothetical protein
MIVVEVRLWTNDLGADGKLLPKHAWSSGVVTMAANKLHGIPPQRELHFNSLTAISERVEKILKHAGVTIHADPGMIRMATSTGKGPTSK